MVNFLKIFGWTLLWFLSLALLWFLSLAVLMAIAACASHFLGPIIGGIVAVILLALLIFLMVHDLTGGFTK